MGFLNSCWQNLLKLSSYAYMVDYDHGQKPLPLPTHSAVYPGAATQGVSFTPQGASPDFQCKYPSLTGWNYCGNASDRRCWLDDPSRAEKIHQYNITTDYEAYSPPGVTREYWLNVSVSPISPDGYVKPLGQVFNNSYPGPILQACWGDEMIVHVTNLDDKNGHTTHWHGLRQHGTNQMDGVNGVTQCPIAQNDTFTYRFKVGQYGHTWYHAHYQVQYSDGAAGPLLLYGPSSADYDEAWPPIFMNDWVHDNASVAFEQELNGGIPVVDNILLDGQGTFLCSDLDPRCCSACHGKCTLDQACATSSNPKGTAPVKTFVPGKRYLLRLINASAESMFLFSIDGHVLEVVANDLVSIHPYKTSSLFIGIGQRYTVVVEAKPSPASVDGNYWIRTRVASGCGNIVQSNEKTGVLRYSDASSNSTPTTNPNDFRSACEDEPTASLVPMVSWTVDNLQNDRDNYTFEADLSKNLNDHGFSRWELLNQALFLNYSDPTILHVDDPSFQYSPDYCIVPYNYSRGYVYLVITGKNINDLDRNTPAAHPIHLHGHDFVILAQENSTFTGVQNFTFNNPPRRDVALLYAGGYLALAFKPDNPGIWLVHCHIAWHASSGLAMQIMEREPEILAALGGESALDNARAGCKGWDDWGLPFQQVDSGI